MQTINWKKEKWFRIGLASLIAFAIAKILFQFSGVYWAYLALFALWLSGKFLAWIRRHPSS